MVDKQQAESEGEDLPRAKFTLTLSLYSFFPPKFLLLFTTRALLWNDLDTRQNGFSSKNKLHSCV
jgi:hypothetical protein